MVAMTLCDYEHCHRPSSSRNIDLDMALSRRSVLDITFVLVVAQAAQICITSVTERPMDTNMVSGG